MKKHLDRIYKKTKSSKKQIIKYLSTNRIFITFVFLTVIEGILVRYYTVGSTFNIKPLIADCAMALLIGSLGYLIRVKRQFVYFFTWNIIISLICLINTIYYVFYLSFASFGMISSLFQVGEVGESVLEKLSLYQFIYLLAPVVFFILHRKLVRKDYYNYISSIEKGKKMFMGTILAAVIFVCFTISTMESTDYSRITKQWNREYLVERFGIVFYQTNDFFQSLTPKINSLFGYDEAAKKFREFYSVKKEIQTNKYTNKYKGKNLVFVHMESIQSFLVDLKVNGKEITPNINKLSKEGMYFSKFYPQISVGTSSDTEFTLTTSLMPALSGTVFVSYTNREYITIPKLMKDMGYYTFSMHGNSATMWNRNTMYKSIGYDRFYSKSDFKIDETVGLGLSDKSFFKQAIPKLEEIEKTHQNYMGTVISLSNHSPFEDLESYGDFDLSYITERINIQTNKKEEVTDTYLNDSKMGNYLKSSHYADIALGEFINYIENSDYFDNTIFVFYGDHEARLNKTAFNILYNYDSKTGVFLELGDEGYIDYDYYKQQLNKNTPLIIWSKNDKTHKQIDYFMGMYDIEPTLGNMYGFNSEYALGNDIFNIKDNNVVIFPNGNFLTNKVYYNNAEDEYIVFSGEPINSDYIQYYKEYTEARLEISNDIIVYDLIKSEKKYLNPVS